MTKISKSAFLRAGKRAKARRRWPASSLFRSGGSRKSSIAACRPSMRAQICLHSSESYADWRIYPANFLPLQSAMGVTKAVTFSQDCADLVEGRCLGSWQRVERQPDHRSSGNQPIHGLPGAQTTGGRRLRGRVE